MDPRWIFEAVGDITSHPLVHEGVVYFGDWKDHYYAVDAETGAEVWRRAGIATGKDLWSVSTEGSVCFPPLVHEGLVCSTSHDKKMHMPSIADKGLAYTLSHSEIQVGARLQRATAHTAMLGNGLRHPSGWRNPLTHPGFAPGPQCFRHS